MRRPLPEISCWHREEISRCAASPSGLGWICRAHVAAGMTLGTNARVYIRERLAAALPAPVGTITPPDEGRTLHVCHNRRADCIILRPSF